MVTPHLPPHQAANALLPHLLGRALLERGHEAHFLTFGGGPDRDGATFVRRRSKRLRKTRVPQALEAAETWWKGAPLVARADVVHIHSNTWMNQVAARLAERQGRPYVLTHYGTEIWHHDGRDAAFRGMNRGARHVTFYSEALLARARELDLPLPAASVVYPPVDGTFGACPESEREAVRREHLKDGGLLILNVKRLHPLADHAMLLDAMALIRAVRKDVTLLIAGSGEKEASLRAQAERLGLHGAVRFLGLVANETVAKLQAAADLFVLSSVLEALPTVALEALASATPVVSTDNPGGVELHALFGDDVAVVPKRDPARFAEAVLAFAASPRRTRPETARTIEDRFRLGSVAARYLALYEEACAR